MIDEGYIKFKPHWKKQVIHVEKIHLDSINEIRTKLIENNWLGVTKEGIGFGNISLRIENSSHFLITGSATGGIKKLSNSDLSMVEKINIQNNSLHCLGETVASSESMSHGVIYEQVPTVNAVLHIHDSDLWNRLKNVLPCSDPKASYGTPEMAKSIQKTLSNSTNGIIIMGGHSDGILAYGHNLYDALNNLKGILPLN